LEPLIGSTALYRADVSWNTYLWGGSPPLEHRPPLRVQSLLRELGPRTLACSGREFKLPWREAGPPYHHDDKVDSDQ